ncbi:MAG: exo-alpha-sialidase [Bacteroidales bacterium]|nr:exo-alpha-sialidase [Bacteroidales bacterium]
MKKLFFVLLLLSGLMAFGQPSHYLTFNGVDQYMSIPHHPDFNIDSDESFSLTAWVRNVSYTEYPRYICKRDAASNSGSERSGYEFFGTPAAGQSLGLNTPTTTSGHALSVYTGITVPAGEWMHIALVVDRAENIIRIFHNGNTNTAWSASLNGWTVENTHDLFVGAGNSGGQPCYFCNGSFGNIRFYNIALDDEMIAADIDTDDISNLPQEMHNALLAAYDMDSANVDDNIMHDISGNGHVANMMNFAFGDAEILNVSLVQESRKIGRANDNEVLLRAAVSFGGENASINDNSLSFSLQGTSDVDDVKSVKIYSTGTSPVFDNRDLQNAVLLADVEPSLDVTDCQINAEIVSGVNYLWITVEMADDATEGNVIDAELYSVSTPSQTFEIVNPSPLGDREIILAHTLLFQPGDYNSTNYRIPGVITAKDGSIVAVTDKRKYNQGDLPEDIDIVCRRSTDGGHTWSEPYTIAQGTGYNHGFGDCVLAWTNDDNGLIAGFVGGVGLWNSTPSNPIRSYIARSYDNGQTWTEPEDITDFIFGSNCVVPEHRTWRASFFGSGNGLITSTGRIMFVAAIRETTAQSLSNYAVYSDDNGITWHVSGRASVSGDEAKVTELVDGRILMSIRHNGKRWYNISNDGGATWQSSTSTWNDITAPACNGDMIRYTSVNQGFNKNRLLHSVPFGSSRTDVSVYISYDEGETWPVRKCIVPYSSAYSSLCVLPDGTIGLYVEEEYPGNSGYSTVFYNFSLEWLTDGADSLDPTFIAENEQQRPSIDVYPVPATSCIVFNEAVKNVEIFDVTGKLVIYKQIAATEKPLVDVSELDKGLYFVVCVDANGVLRNGRFIK